MAAVAIEELGERIRDYVRRAAEGETVLIEEGGKVVARLVPTAEDERARDQAFIKRLVDSGLAAPATNRDAGPPPRMEGFSVPFEKLMADLDEDRADRW
jgi:antitoxin (DNA-binding transcriptional repressor) of toxin-antitoxin stability system